MSKHLKKRGIKRNKGVYEGGKGGVQHKRYNDRCTKP
jgi:hypothetical protein